MKNTIFTWDSKDKIWRALEIYNNWYTSEKLRDEAIDVLLEQFHDQLSLEWEIDMSEHWYSEEEIDHYRNTTKEIEWETQHLFDTLNPIWF